MALSFVAFAEGVPGAKAFANAENTQVDILTEHGRLRDVTTSSTKNKSGDMLLQAYPEGPSRVSLSPSWQRHTEARKLGKKLLLQTQTSPILKQSTSPDELTSPALSI